MTVGVVIPAGGSGARMGGEVPKQFRDLAGKPLFQYALEAFLGLPQAAEVALVLPQAFHSRLQSLALPSPKLRLVAGGAERHDSVRRGVEALSPAVTHILIHDAARPFVPASLILRCMQGVLEGKCLVAALPAADTVKEVDGGKVVRTLERSRLVQVQTPQAFPRDVLEAVYSRGWDQSPYPTDEAQMAEICGFAVEWIEGHPLNRKVTVEEDLAWAEWMAGRLRAEAGGG